MSTSLAVMHPDTPDFTREKIELIKRTLCVGATDDELQLFLYTARRTGLDPLARQIHMVKRWNSAAKREVATIQTGIDGYRLIADRTGKLAGIGDAEFDDESKDHPGKATVTVRKLVDGVAVDFTASARWSEYVQTYKPKDSDKFKVSPMWEKMPYLMLGKCAEALALRKAFPADLSGVYTFEEMGQADNDPKPQGQPAQQQQQQVRKPAPEVQRKSQKGGLPPMGSGKPTESTICAECRVADGHAPTCPYNPANKNKASQLNHGDAYEGEEVVAEPTKEEKAAAREKKWIEYPGHDPKIHINFRQNKLLFVVQSKVGITEDQMKTYMLENLKVEHRPHILKEHFTPLLDAIDADGEHHKLGGQ